MAAPACFRETGEIILEATIWQFFFHILIENNFSYLIEFQVQIQVSMNVEKITHSPVASRMRLKSEDGGQKMLIRSIWLTNHQFIQSLSAVPLEKQPLLPFSLGTTILSHSINS